MCVHVQRLRCLLASSALLQVATGHGTPDPHPHPHPRFAGDRGSTPIPIPDLPESGIQLSTIESRYCKGVEFRLVHRLPQCLTLRLIVQPIKLFNLRRPAMSDDAVDYSGTSDSDSESDKVPSRLPARAEQAVRVVGTSKYFNSQDY